MYTINDHLRDYVEPRVTSESVPVPLFNQIIYFIYFPNEGEKAVEEVAAHIF